MLDVEGERCRQVTVGGDLRLEIGDLLLGDGDPIGAGDEAPRRRLLIGDVYSPEPGTPSYDAIRLLASWATTNQKLARTESARATDGT